MSTAAVRRNRVQAMTTRAILCLCLLLALGACQHTPKEEPDAATLAQRGMRAFERQKWNQAVDAFQKVKDRYPFSPYALSAEIKIADALYMQENYEEAFVAYQDFERMHPRNDAVPYAVFMEGMSNYQRLLSKDRDQTPTSEALRHFQRLLADYPDSPLAAEAKAKIGECLERLAAQEIYVARWYDRTGHHRSALARLNYVIAHYPETQSAAQAKQMLPEVETRVATEEEKPVELAPAPAQMDGGVERTRRPVP